MDDETYAQYRRKQAERPSAAKWEARERAAIHHITLEQVIAILESERTGEGKLDYVRTHARIKDLWNDVPGAKSLSHLG